ncbi:MAG: GAF domain-containing sensor histidine kinase [Caldilineaceae bacterium]|nr:GAF domain-containing sensor histidine kinase [Caldilineaceae bacterium]
MRSDREVVILNEIAQALNRSVDLAEALQTTLAQMAALFGLHTGWIWLRNERTDQFYLAAAQNLPPVLAQNPARMEGWCHCLESYEEGDLEGAANINVIVCTRLKNLVRGTDGLRYHATIPLYAHGKELGVLNLASSDWRELSDEDLRLLYTIGDLLSIAIERARLYARSIESGAIEERNRLAREIHDTLAQGLSAIALHLETADLLLETASDPTRIRQAIQQALQLSRTNLEEARRSVHDLRAAPLEGKTLAEALEQLAQATMTKTQLPVKFHVVGAHRPLPVAVEAGLYRVAQEAITNSCTHAQATSIQISLNITPQLVQLVIYDDGCGFEAEAIAPNRYGLVGMNERVRLLGGELHMESMPTAGTKVVVTVPLES